VENGKPNCTPEDRNFVTDLDKLKYYREEVRHEFNLLGQRMGWYVVCQSFLITAFTLSITKFLSDHTLLLYIYTYLIIILGLTTSSLISGAILGAHTTIDIYVNKKYYLMKNSSILFNMKTIRDDCLADDDEIHKASLIFSGKIPTTFSNFWILLGFVNLLSPFDLNKLGFRLLDFCFFNTCSSP
jgi:hypothetical protein